MSGPSTARAFVSCAATAWVGALVATILVSAAAVGPSSAADPPARPATWLFDLGSGCMACHNQLVTPSGEDVSIGTAWRASIMANSSRDPYWQGSVRREALDHGSALATIEAECSTCHMPMSNEAEQISSLAPALFAHLPAGRQVTPLARLAADGVSCTICHQIQPDKLGTPESFTGRFVLDRQRPVGQRPVFGPFEIDAGHATLMRSATTFVPVQGMHVRDSGLCATCHMLYTTPLGPDGTAIGRFPEQVPFLEWQHSAFRDERSCQSCHMPEVDQATPIVSVTGQPRTAWRRHTFRGVNFVMLDILNRYRQELGVEALPSELAAARDETIQFLQNEAATIAVEPVVRGAGAPSRLLVDVVVGNLAGHKLPSAYPSRRAWIHLLVKDSQGREVFESGRLAPTGLIEGNDNDADGTKFEPHYRQIDRADEVQVYEPILGDAQGKVTTGLLSAVRYLKDNRLLPVGFEKATAKPDFAVVGEAFDDTDFVGGGDRVRYAVDVSRARGPFTVEAEINLQPIGFRWADNLAPYDAGEPQRFLGYYRAQSAQSAVVLARAVRRIE